MTDRAQQSCRRRSRCYVFLSVAVASTLIGSTSATSVTATIEQATLPKRRQRSSHVRSRSVKGSAYQSLSVEHGVRALKKGKSESTTKSRSKGSKGDDEDDFDEDEMSMNESDGFSEFDLLEETFDTLPSPNTPLDIVDSPISSVMATSNLFNVDEPSPIFASTSSTVFPVDNVITFPPVAPPTLAPTEPLTNAPTRSPTREPTDAPTGPPTETPPEDVDNEQIINSIPVLEGTGPKSLLTVPEINDNVQFTAIPPSWTIPGLENIP